MTGLADRQPFQRILLLRLQLISSAVLPGLFATLKWAVNDHAGM